MQGSFECLVNLVKNLFDSLIVFIVHKQVKTFPIFKNEKY